MRPTPAAVRRAALVPLLAALVLLPGCGQTAAPEPDPDPSAEADADPDRARDDAGGAEGDAEAEAARPSEARSARAFPALGAGRQVTGLAQPWDVQLVPGVGLLIDERETGRLYVARGGTKKQVSFPADQVWASGETGLMGLAVDPGFRENRRFYTCHGGFAGGGRKDVRVDAWRLSGDESRAVRRDILLTGLPATTGRHGGCRLLITRDGALVVGTGDAAVSRNPQNRRSLGGKVLRLDRWSGRPWRGNPWTGAENRNRRYVLTYGHRNVQGLAQRGDGTLWSIEHGPDRDDEVNRLVRGGNYGWDPKPGYGEGVPMTDFSLPGRQQGARWRSGSDTLATSGGAFVRGKKWGAYRGTLAVAALKTERLVFMKFDGRGRLQWTRTPAATSGPFGRLRSVTRANNNDLLVTTADGTGDAVIRVRPR